MQNVRTPVIIPSETQSREFDAKLLLACVLAERGYPSIVGSRNEIHMAIARLPRSIYVGKDVRHSSDRISRILKRLGHVIVALDEEGLVYYSRAAYSAARIAPPSFRATAALMAWGPDNALAWRESSHYHGVPIHETGNPRVDMMRPELRPLFAAETEALRQRFGRFLLINTNFGNLNHFFPNLGSLKAPATPEPPPPGADWATGLAHHRYGIFHAFLRFVPVLAARHPQTAIVIRPHPAENHETWLAAARGAANVHVLHEGNVVPWLLAAEAVIHNGCTTGLETYVLGGRPIAFRPLTSDKYDLDLPNSLSHEVFDEAGLLAAADAVVEGRFTVGREQAQARRALLDRHIAAIDGKLAVERIADVVDSIELAGGSRRAPGLGTRLVGHVAAEWRSLQKRRNASKPRHKSNVAYTRHRFPGIELPKVQERIDAYGRILGRFGRVRARSINGNIFRIDPG
ncbi:surface carbohydrate biosynthesis protein [Vineibacter terrae]|uniref:surface carbohydrate biosynthesis protein n=1 Tax=Vineibacter terrae TaxID=2586908 RepID=UPI002E355954|nr:surface carbohydrate biosynthesis protein [Vineibacter terrae]HEX2885045.1 surface carbohydrate biosynthesis protein [Vineibacter terrae]